MQRWVSISLFSMSLGVAAGSAQAGMIASETFDTDGTLAEYTGEGQIFADYAMTGSPVAQAADGEFDMQLVANQAGSLFTRIDLGGPQSLLSVKLDFKGEGYSAATGAFGLYAGSFDAISDFSSWNTHEGARNWAKIQVVGGNPYTVSAQDGVNTNHQATGQAVNQYNTWSIYLNDSGEAQQLLGPDGQIHVLEDSSWSFFIDDTLVADSVPKGTGGANGSIEGLIFHLGRNYDGGSSRSALDNIVIRDDLAIYVPEPASLALLGLGALGLLRRRGTR